MTGMLFDPNKAKKNKRTKSFFRKSAQHVAKNILGDYLVLKDKNDILAGKIVETEAYFGVGDDASHSFGGKVTPRNKIMYGQPGLIYVYFIYGMHWCFNVVTSRQGDPQAVLIRGLEPVEGIKVMQRRRKIKDIKRLTSGPCRWTQSFGIDRDFSGKSTLSDEIFISRNQNKRFSIVETKRVGIDYAIKTKDMPLRFYIAGSAFISKK